MTYIYDGILESHQAREIAENNKKEHGIEQTMEDKLQELADNLTNNIMSFIYGERFDITDDITEDEELSKAWEYINEKSFGSLWDAWDEGNAQE